MRILLIGASGQLGTALRSAFTDAGVLVETAHAHVRDAQVLLDLSDHVALRRVLTDVGPEVVLVAGAMCHVDACEQDPERCRAINTEGATVVAGWLAAHGGRLVFFSTDHVFDGKRPGPYVETDVPNPLSVYAQSKWDAERAIGGLLPAAHLVIRTGWLYGPDPERRNFALRLVDRLGAGETVRVPADQWGSPTFTDDVARATRWLIDRRLTGTFHATGPDFLDRPALAAAICATFGANGSLVTSEPTRALGQAARRSLRVQLSCGKLLAAGAPRFRGVSDGLAALARWNSSRRESRRSHRGVA